MAGLVGKAMDSVGSRFKSALKSNLHNLEKNKNLMELGQRAIKEDAYADRIVSAIKNTDTANLSKEEAVKAFRDNGDIAILAKDMGVKKNEVANFANMMSRINKSGNDIDLKSLREDVGTSVDDRLKELAKKQAKLNESLGDKSNILSQGVNAITTSEKGMIGTGKDFFMAADRQDLTGNALLGERAKRMAGGLVVANGAKDVIDIMTGHREGLTQEQGQRDIAGIPFI